MRRSDARNGTRDEEPGGDNFARERKRDFGPEIAFNLRPRLYGQKLSRARGSPS